MMANFHPSDLEMIRHFLHPKINGGELGDGGELIVEHHLYGTSPERFNWNPVARLKDNERYFFVKRKPLSRMIGRNAVRRVDSGEGFWKKSRIYKVNDERGNVVGHYDLFNFYSYRTDRTEKNSVNSIKSEFLMREYFLPGSTLQDWVICFVKYKIHTNVVVPQQPPPLPEMIEQPPPPPPELIPQPPPPPPEMIEQPPPPPPEMIEQPPPPPPEMIEQAPAQEQKATEQVTNEGADASEPVDDAWLVKFLEETQQQEEEEEEATSDDDTWLVEALEKGTIVVDETQVLSDESPQQEEEATVIEEEATVVDEEAKVIEEEATAIEEEEATVVDEEGKMVDYDQLIEQAQPPPEQLTHEEKEYLDDTWLVMALEAAKNDNTWRAMIVDET